MRGVWFSGLRDFCFSFVIFYRVVGYTAGVVKIYNIVYVLKIVGTKWSFFIKS